MKPTQPILHKANKNTENKRELAEKADGGEFPLCPRCRLAPLRTDHLLNRYCPRCGYRVPGAFT